VETTASTLAAQALELRNELVVVDVVRDLAAREVPEFVGLHEIVHRDHVRDAVPVQPFDEPRADESRGACDHVAHHPFLEEPCLRRSPNSSCRVTSAVPNLVTLMPPARIGDAHGRFEAFARGQHHPRGSQ